MKLNEETGFYENYGFHRVPFWQTRCFSVAMITLFILLVVIACFLIVRYVLKKRSEKKLPPKAQLLQDLAIIEHEARERQSHSESYFMLTSAIKGFLISQYRLPISQMTAPEIIAYLPTTTTPQRWTDLAKDIFLKSQSIVFGGEHIEGNSIIIIVNRVKEVLELDVDEKDGLE